MSGPAFWKQKRLDRMTREEWESLCDGCGKCCLHKLEDVDTGEIAMTDVACGYLDLEHCRCTDYRRRQSKVPDCVKLTPANITQLPWLPESCAYLPVHHGKDLPPWHHLVCGDREAIHYAGKSVRDRVVSENEVKDLESHVTDWLEAGGDPWFHVPAPNGTPPPRDKRK